MKFKNNSGEEVEAFCWLVDEVPEWWRDLEGVQIETSTTTAVLPSGGSSYVGDYIVRNADGEVSTVPRHIFMAEYAPLEKPIMLRGPGEGKSFKQRFWGEWVGKQIVLQCKGRAIIIGTLRAFENGFLRIEDAQIKGVRNLARVRTLMVDRDHVGHFHEPGEIETLDERGLSIFDPGFTERKSAEIAE